MPYKIFNHKEFIKTLDTKTLDTLDKIFYKI